MELVVKNFSFIDDPNGTLAALKRIGEIESAEPAAYLHFDDPECLDLGPYLVLGEIWPQMAHGDEGTRPPDVPAGGTRASQRT